jgi:hypothetical protein
MPAPSVPPIASSAENIDRAVQILALLQRDARFVDFVTEDIATYSDEQVGAAVRTVHASCRQVLSRYFDLAPILDAEEGATVPVDATLNPAEIKLVGNVRGASRGVLQHRGWRVTASHLPPLPEPAGRTVLAQAEVEVS